MPFKHGRKALKSNGVGKVLSGKKGAKSIFRGVPKKLLK